MSRTWTDKSGQNKRAINATSNIEFFLINFCNRYRCNIGQMQIRLQKIQKGFLTMYRCKTREDTEHREGKWCKWRISKNIFPYLFIILNISNEILIFKWWKRSKEFRNYKTIKEKIFHFQIEFHIPPRKLIGVIIRNTLAYNMIKTSALCISPNN